ncbi:MAG TPA: hypothetical protein VK814_18650 [Acidobacteriaceae bacterium]|jgi:hypothetical protein|nr:hypothetical protein [Acidobacteriaceae bacterium]
MHQLFSSKYRSSAYRVSLALFVFGTTPFAFFGTTLHAQQATLADSPSTPALLQTAAAAPALDLSVPQYISSSADTDQPAPPADIDAPVPQTQSNEPPPKQTSRILGILPNFRAVSADVKLPPQTAKEKFGTAFKDSFDYSAIFIPLALAGYGVAENTYPEFGSGGVAFGRYLWHAAADQTIENLLVEGIVPSITREDNRYYTLGRGGFWKRTGYAVTRTVVTRNDAGNETFNISEVFGSAAAGGISTTYYPTRERSIGTFGTQWGTNIGIDALSFVVKEFWPDVNHALFHGAKPSQTTQHP